MKQICSLIAVCLFTACAQHIEADYVIENGAVYLGDRTSAQLVSIAVLNDEIVYIGDDQSRVVAEQSIDATGLIVVPGFIDPHTHSLSELESDDALNRRNLNYQTQGVTTVVNGNDGFGAPDIAGQIENLSEVGIGTNTALFIGHGELRKQVMGGDKRAPTDDELSEMESHIRKGMQDGALGLSTGLFYAPGSFSDTEEVIALARVVAEYDGIYDSHIRDESTYSVGLLPAIDEVIEIARKAEVPVHIAHIKALGVDVWGDSEAIVARVEAAHDEGLKVTADQYPWQASGTRISNALIPRWVKAGSQADYLGRLNDPENAARIRIETTENLRKRGGPDAVLITSGDESWVNKTLREVAKDKARDPVDMAIHIARNGDARIASFNMNMTDIERFMVQDWVMTSSDGSTGHPRKFASYPKKFQDYVIEKKLLSLEDYIYRSSGQVAETFGLCDRGFIREGYKADIAIIDPDNFIAHADFKSPNRLTTGVSYLFVNGVPVIHDGEPQTVLPGRVLKKCHREGVEHAQ